MRKEYDNIGKLSEISKVVLDEKEKEYIQNTLNKFKDELDILNNINNKSDMSFGYTENTNVYSTSDIESDRESILDNSKFRDGNFIKFKESRNE